MAFQSRRFTRVSATFTQRMPSRSTRSEPTGRHVCGMLPGLKLVRFRPAGCGLPLFQVACPFWNRPLLTAGFILARSVICPNGCLA